MTFSLFSLVAKKGRGIDLNFNAIVFT